MTPVSMGRLAGVGIEQLELHGGDYFVFASSGEVGSVAESVTVRSGKTAAVELRVPQGEALAGAMVARGFGESILLSVWDNRLIEGAYYSQGKPVRAARIKVTADTEEIGAFVLELVAGRTERVVTDSPKTPPVRSNQQSAGSELPIIGMVMGGTGAIVGGTLYGLGHALNDGDLKAGGLITGVGGALIFATSAMVEWVF